jgi:hypothetical protein
MKLILVTAVLLLGASACTSSPDFGECDPPPALASGETFALSCAAEVTWEGRTYGVSAGDFHESWIGEKVAGQGGTEFEAAFRLKTYSPDEVIALQNPSGHGSGFLLGFTDSFEETDYMKIKEPFGAASNPSFRCARSARGVVDGEIRKVEITVEPCPATVGQDISVTLTNTGPTRLGYGPGFKLERRVQDRWEWVNRDQAFELPLFYLESGKTSEPETIEVYLDEPDPISLKPGVYRVSKTLQLTPGKPIPPTMTVRAKFALRA